MRLTRADFRQQIDSVILERGEAYYQSGAVQDIVATTDAAWAATVLGSEDYFVTLSEAVDGELVASCDCPFDWGPVCKHVAATLFALEAHPEKPRRTRKRRQSRAEKLRSALATLQKDQLVDLLVELADGDRQMAHALLTQYGEPTQSKADAARLVRDALRFGTDRGFIDYRSSRQVAQAILPLLNRADEQFRLGRIGVALPIYQAIIEELIPAFSYADDSSGSMGDCVSFATSRISEIALSATGKQRQTIFAYLLALPERKGMLEWDWCWDLLATAATMVTDSRDRGAAYQAMRQQLFATLDALPIDDADSWSSQFNRDRIATIQLAVIEQEDDPDAVLAFLEARTDSYQFVEKLARWHLAQGNLDQARHICQAWLANHQGRLWGVINTMRGILIDVARLQENRTELTRLLELQFIATSDFTYYDELKALNSAEWPTVRTRLIEQVGHTRADIFVRETMWPALLTYVQQNPWSVTQYGVHLTEQYSQEVGNVYVALAEQTLQQQKNRKGYRAAIGYLKQLRTIGQEGQMLAVVTEWRSRYKNRPALLDELNKAFGGI
jgi:hypothetical protein